MTPEELFRIQYLKTMGFDPGIKLKKDMGGPSNIYEGFLEGASKLVHTLSGGTLGSENPYNRKTPLELSFEKAGDRVRLAKAQEAYNQTLEPPTPPSSTESEVRTSPALDPKGTAASTDAQIDFATRMMPLYQQMLDINRANTLAQTAEQANLLYPLLSRSASEATSRALAASKDFLAFKQQQPLAQQAIMESKQKQMSGAADAFLKEAMAMATQQDAASRFGSLGTGRRFG